MKARIHITLKQNVLDPQGKVIARALKALGFIGVSGVRQGKYIEIDLKENSGEAAQASVDAMCAKLLANTVIEDYSIEIES